MSADLRETGTLDQRFADSMGQLLGPDFPGDIALAVSGGGDSMAMLYLAHNWTRIWGLRLWVVTVDHGLRAEAAAEAEMVARECATLGWPHATLRWRWDGRGNVQEAARAARLALIDGWRGGIAHVLMAHTRDDLAETFLMRLARGSGVEGLSAMSARRDVAPRQPAVESEDMSGARAPAGAGGESAGMQILRPCLDMRREELRHYLRTLHGPWIEDPSNEDPVYERVRIRRLMTTLEAEGLGVDTLAETAARLSRAREALCARAAEVWSRIGREPEACGAPTGELQFARAGFHEVEQDTRMRLLAAALQYVSSAPYRPRAEAIEALIDRLLGGGAGTLHGCEIRAEGDRIAVFREESAVAGLREPVVQGALWDGRWWISSSEFNGFEIAPLGAEGWAQADSRAPDAPAFRAARALPAIWAEGRLVACDALGVGPGATVRLCPFGGRAPGFANFLLSH